MSFPRAQSGRTGRLARFVAGGLLPVTVLLAAYFVVSIAIRLMLPGTLTLDEAEQSLFSQYWLAGYGAQPPFYNWVQDAFVAVMGISLFSLTLTKFSMLLLVYVFFGLAAREIDERPGFVAMAVLSLLMLPQVSYMPQQDLTHTVAVLMATSLFFYGLFRTLRRSDWAGYAILGVAIGIGTISKYNFVLLPAAAVVAVFCDREWRPRLFDPRVLLTALLSLLVVLPHLLWLVDNVHVATAGTIGKMVESGAPQGVVRIVRALGSLGLACIAFSALAVVILAVAFKRNVRAALVAGDRWTRLLGLIILVSLAGVVLVILVAGTTKITERWLDPYLLILPLYLLRKLDRAGANVTESLGRFVPVFLVIMAITLVALAGRAFGGLVTGKYIQINFPFPAAAEILRSEDSPSVVVTSGMHLAGNMRVQFPQASVVNVRQAIAGFPKKDALKAPILVIWRDTGSGKNPPMDLSAYKALGLGASPVKSLELPYYYSSGDIRLVMHYLWLR